jgi:hypothetical protein
MGPWGGKRESITRHRKPPRSLFRARLPSRRLFANEGLALRPGGLPSSDQRPARRPRFGIRLSHPAGGMKTTAPLLCSGSPAATERAPLKAGAGSDWARGRAFGLRTVDGPLIPTMFRFSHSDNRRHSDDSRQWQLWRRAISWERAANPDSFCPVPQKVGVGRFGQA